MPSPTTVSTPLRSLIQTLSAEFDKIPPSRKAVLGQFAGLIKTKLQTKGRIQLNFICTHNSRRSHIAQIWAQTTAMYFGIDGIHTYSGGTEATAFNPRAVSAMQNAGFRIEKKRDDTNPLYEVILNDNSAPLRIFSKAYDDPFNPKGDFTAVMTCSHADANCPVVIGADSRISITYDDPKDFDDTPLETEKYKERVDQIGREMLYAFSLLVK